MPAAQVTPVIKTGTFARMTSIPMPMRRFEEYGVLVTGAARGIGAATARRLTQEGARVLVADVDLAEAQRTAAVLRGQGGHAEAFACDVAERDSVEAAVAHAAGTFGSLDVLVNNAAHCSPYAPLFEDETDEAWALDLDVTLTGVYRCSRAALPHLVASGRGAIVTIGSVNGIQDFGNHGYSAAKAGLISLTRTLAGHAGPRGVRVNLVAPGTVRTAAWAGRDDDLDAVARLYPLERVGEPEDIAAAVAFLASSDAAWITGTTLCVDGGLTAVNTGFRRAVRGEDEIVRRSTT
jgi:NAD(P)-dependent dehydrogenase (short-subunit alcohol dehydrogenase family)